MVEPAFIQAYPKHLLAKRFDNYPKTFLKCPMDGGRWDSNQHQYRLTVILKKILSSFVRIYRHAFHDFLVLNKATISV